MHKGKIPQANIDQQLQYPDVFICAHKKRDIERHLEFTILTVVNANRKFYVYKWKVFELIPFPHKITKLKIRSSKNTKDKPFLLNCQDTHTHTNNVSNSNKNQHFHLQSNQHNLWIGAIEFATMRFLFCRHSARMSCPMLLFKGNKFSYNLMTRAWKLSTILKIGFALLNYMKKIHDMFYANGHGGLPR